MDAPNSQNLSECVQSEKNIRTSHYYDSEAKKHTAEPTPPQRLSILEHQLRLVFYHKFLKIQTLKLNFLTDSSDSGKLAMSRMHSSGHVIHTADPITI